MHQHTKAFEENILVVCDELHLAKKWGKASIILTTHRSSGSQEKTKKALQNKIEKLGFSIVEIEISTTKGKFIDTLLQHDNVEEIVFFISNIDWGGGKDDKDGYRTLNLYRETFVERNIKAIFFLTLRETSNLPIQAPDFWAFRHRTLEFGTPRTFNQKLPPVKIMLWHLGNSVVSIPDIEKKITGLTETFANIPDQAETVSLRIDMQYELGFLYWHLGDLLGAESSLKNGIDLAKSHDLFDPLVKLNNGLVILYYEWEKYHIATELLETLIKENPHDCILLLNQAILLFAMKKRYDAIAKGKKATSLCSKNSWVWNSLGFLQYYAGNMNEATSCFQEAIRISPKDSYFYESVAVGYLTNNLLDKAQEQLHQAQKCSGSRIIFQNVLKDYLEGNAENAVSILKKAVSTGELTESDIVRDPILYALPEIHKQMI